MTEPTPNSTDELAPSRLFTFIDQNREFALYLLEGQRLIQDVALLHPVRGAGFAYFRDVVLSVQPMIALLKHGEQLGFYIDSDEPAFRLKIESGHHGAVRCMLLPESFQEFPEAMHGLVRLQKLSPQRKPYESVLKIEGAPLRELINRVLAESYQINSRMLVSQQSDQSVLLHQLPPLPNRNEYEYSDRAVASRLDEIHDGVEQILARALCEPKEIADAFGEIGFRMLTFREVRLDCSCSRTRVLQNMRLVHQQNRGQLFRTGEDRIDVRCEYCKQGYSVTRTDVEQASSPLN